MFRHAQRSGVLLVALMAATCGCGSSTVTVTGADMESSTLNELGESYRMYQIGNKKPPTKPADLAKLESQAGNAVAAVKKGDLLVGWGATLPDTSEEPGKVSSSEVLAYGKDVPTQGGQVLMLDRTIKKMTADEFKAAKLAGTEASSAKPAAGKK
jgi:hypothetical protein